MAKYWANILCNEQHIPYRVIITDGMHTTELPVSGTPVPKLRRILKEMYDIPPRRIMVTEIIGNV
jgi:hypothetical protein